MKLKTKSYENIWSESLRQKSSKTLAMKNPEEKLQPIETSGNGCPFHSFSSEKKVAPNPRLTLNVIPRRFLEWLVSSRKEFLNNLMEGKPMRFFSAHLPTMVSWKEGEQFPVNMTVKGIGLIPAKKYLRGFTDLFEDTTRNALSSDWDETMVKRIGANKKLYQDIRHFEPSLMGGLEIFEEKAFENLKANPYTSLLFVGMLQTEHGLQYVSFQVNGEVEILEKDNPYYRYLLSSRKLFEFDKFHLYQPDYPFGYLIKVKEVWDKAPWTRTDLK